MNQDWSTIIFIGRSGSGKGTQLDLLKVALPERKPGQITNLGTGELFRNFVKSDSYTSGLARKILEVGGRQPDFLAIWLWAGLFASQPGPMEHLVGEGFPRSAPEAMILDTAFKFYERANPTIIYLKVGNETAAARLKARGRADDQTDEQINKRLAWFDEEVMPAVEWFRNNPDYHFLEIDGEPSVEAIHQDILAKL